MKREILATICGAMLCCSCSDSYYLANDLGLDKLNSEYELYSSGETVLTRAGDEEKIETRASEDSIKASMDAYVTELMNRTSIAKERVMRSTYGVTGNLVGVFKNGSCSSYKELTVHLDCEDKRTKQKLIGEVGDTDYDGSGNIDMRFCLTEAYRYYPGGVFLINNNYIGERYILVRHHDTEDGSKGNWVYCSAESDDYNMESISTGFTHITPSDAVLAWAFPAAAKQLWESYEKGPVTNIHYGLLAPEGRESGSFLVDDEDSRNANWMKVYSGSTLRKDFANDRPQSVMRWFGIEGGGNTIYKVMLSTSSKFGLDKYYAPGMGGW